jgi:hypothetical protein
VPENTWFHTPLLQPLSSLLRVKNCCCDPLMTIWSKRESAMNPPLAYDGWLQ